jgi:hypothetical protein
MWLVKGAPNLMRRLYGLPSPPDVALLHRRQPKPFPWLHINTTFRKQTHIKWCCVGLLRPPDFRALGERPGPVSC